MSGLPVLVTRRLVLKPWTRGDTDALLAMWKHPDVRRYLWDDSLVSRDQVADIIESHFATSAAFGIGYWMVSPSKDGPAAGFCGFRFEGDTEVELLFGFVPEYWGRGFATEASQAALDYLWASPTFPQVWAHTDVPNIKSVAVLERLGMSLHSSTPERITFLMKRPAQV